MDDDLNAPRSIRKLHNDNTWMDKVILAITMTMVKRPKLFIALPTIFSILLLIFGFHHMSAKCLVYDALKLLAYAGTACQEGPDIKHPALIKSES